jgi:phosphate transport system substrate-binding protein
MRETAHVARFGILLIAISVIGCSTDGRESRSDSGASASASASRVDLTGAGATFPYPLYSRWFNDYAQRTNVRINYQSIGSGGGIRQMMVGTVDFGATDVPMSDAEMAQAASPIVHLPTVLGAVAVTYNLPQLKRPLQLAGPLLAEIFLGKVTRWNDPKIAALNVGAPLPHSEILVVHRADGSGTSYIFSDYLTAVSKDWANGPGRGKDVRWPAGIGGKGNEGVAGQVKQMVGSVGYVEVVYARQNHLPVAHLQNRVGRFISPMPYEIASAATSAMAVAENATDLRLSLVNAPGNDAYPIVSFTWMLIAPDAIGVDKTRQLSEFLRWALADGSDIASTMGYVALPSVTASKVLELIESLHTSAPKKP